MKLKSFLIKIIISLGSLLVISGFFSKAHAQSDLQTIAPSPITVEAKILDRCDSIQLFNRNLLKDGFQPLQITIKNPTDQNYQFSPDKTTLNLSSEEEIIAHSKPDTFHFLPFSLLFPSHAPLKNLFALSAPHLKRSLFLASPHIPLLGKIPFTASTEAHFKQKIEKHQPKAQIIKANSSLNIVLIAPEDLFSENFQITLISEKTQEPKILEVIAR